MLRRAQVAVCQALSGTGALRLSTDFFKKFYNVHTILLSDPSWGEYSEHGRDDESGRLREKHG